MITIDLARRLVAGGVLWEPQPGDRFTIDQPGVAGEVFWISELTVDVHSYHGQPLLGFNGTTEWALDSVTLDTALWLPREDQLRALLGDRFRRLSRDGSSWTVALLAPHAADADSDADITRVTDVDAECAYARALLTLT